MFETPLDFLMDEANHQLHEREWAGQRRRYYAMPHDDRYIWGATAGMLRNLWERLYSLMVRALFEPLGAVPAAFRACSRSIWCLRAKFPLAVEHWTRGRVELADAGRARRRGVRARGADRASRRAATARYVPAHVENGVIVPGRFE